MSTERGIIPSARHKAGPDEPLVEPADREAEALKLNLKRQLQRANRLKAEAEQYRLASGLRARSEAQQLILEARLAIKREISKLELEVFEEAKKLLVDIRLIRLTAQQELEAQRQFTNAARITALSGAGREKTVRGGRKGSGRQESA